MSEVGRFYHRKPPLAIGVKRPTVRLELDACAPRECEVRPREEGRPLFEENFFIIYDFKLYFKFHKGKPLA